MASSKGSTPRRGRKATHEASAIVFVQRPRVEVRNDFRRRWWRSKCGRFAVVESRFLLGPQSGDEALPVVWYAMRFEGSASRWDVISRHRRRTAAVRACTRAAR